MSNKVKSDEKENFIVAIKNQILDSFGNSRVECLILYGSALSEGDRPVNDYDCVLLLDTYDENDFESLKKINENIRSELFLDYKDQIIRKGINNYQRGRHGVYFFVALAYGECLIGDNYYLKNINNIDQVKVKRDLLFRIEEYFYRIQKHYINDKNGLDIQYIKKYISRIVFDLLLFKGVIHFVDFHKINYLDIFKKYVYEKKVFCEKLSRLIREFIESNNVSVVPELVGELYDAYLLEFDILNK